MRSSRREIRGFCLVKGFEVELELGSSWKKRLEWVQGRQVWMGFIHSEGIIPSTRRIATSATID
jgi:hypothetical protein